MIRALSVFATLTVAVLAVAKPITLEPEYSSPCETTTAVGTSTGLPGSGTDPYNPISTTGSVTVTVPATPTGTANGNPPSTTDYPGGESGTGSGAGSTGTGGGDSTGSSGGQCNTGPVQCCNSIQSASSSTATSLLGLLGIILQDLNVLVGINCTPINVIGIGGNSCSSQPVCCENNQFEGLISIGCTPININL
ncbi:hydrophobin-domain-containing protein [Dendrothele bispora CBS 962.96]|uniref:Hydrophobin n=1 Tax=Dendrothele bispora (strain CBS 962.96) TaxID=1314807 RepID=A0A4S8M9I5_DENBC|nr:hydrophobin-domain-containing protein [Dendrothele bispora CBS 962.96]